MNKLSSFLFKQKIVILVLLLIASLFFIIFGDVSKNNLSASILDFERVNPYILVTEGNAIIKRDKIIKIVKGQKEDIFKGDKIRTLTKTTATIFWSDGSITRLGEKTSINITDLNIKKDNSSSIKFDIEGGKSWSNIVRYLNNSSFTQTYDNERLAATVRGTVFEINIDKEYVYAVNHSIVIKDTSNNKDYEIPEGKIRKSEGNLDFLSDRSIEKAWVNWNKKEDIIYINKLLNQWRKKLDSTLTNKKLKESINNLLDGKKDNLDEIKDTLNSSFDTKNKEELNKFFLNFYQNINNIPNTPSSILLKANLRNEIIDSSDNENKPRYIKDFLRLNMYDFLDKNMSQGQKRLKKYVDDYTDKNLDKGYIRSLLRSLPEDKINEINNIFEDINGPIKDILKESQNKDLKQKAIENVFYLNNQIDDAKNSLNDNIDSAKDSIIKFFKNNNE